MDDRELDLDALEKVALAATQEPWEWDSGIIPPDGPGRYADIYTDAGELIIAHFNDQIPEGQANAAHIASFDPPTVLKLIALARPKAGEPDRIGTHSENCHTWGPRHYNCLLAKFEALAAAPEPLRVAETVSAYDAGLLSDYGGGNVEWWQDYIRAELDRAHEYYMSALIEPSAGGGEA